MKISLGKYQKLVSSLDFVEGDQSRLRVLRPAVLLGACTCHETIWTESIAVPARAVSIGVHLRLEMTDKIYSGS